MTAAQFIFHIDNLLYTRCMIYLLVGAGLYFTLRTGFVQIRLLGASFRCMMEKKRSEKGVSSFQALMIATASRVGTGNMAGVATAIVIGGPGSAFWMWAIAVIGAASAFVESTLAQIYKRRDGDVFKGGPAYYIERALNARWLGVSFAVSLIVTFAVGFNGLQSFNIVSAFQYYVPSLEQSGLPVFIGLFLSVVSLFLFFGGTEKIGMVSAVLVPFMAIVYILMGVIIVILNVSEIPAVFSAIFRSAFDFKAIFGGFSGSCLVYGIKRGLFSNEAGMGSAPNASASADVSHPAKQGLAQTVSVYIDTLLICSTTVFILLLTDVYKTDPSLTGIPLLQQSMKTQFGAFSAHLITVSVCLFAFTSIIGNYYYAESNILFINKNPKVMKVFRVLSAIVVFFGAQNNIDLAWHLSDLMMGIQAVVNIVAITLLSGIAFRALKDYERQQKEGKDPVFYERNIGLTNTDVWKG